MFSVPLKECHSTNSQEFSDALSEWLDRDNDSQISNTPPISLSLKTVKNLRTLSIPSNPSPTCLKYKSDLHKYHACLLSLESTGFPTTSSSTGGTYKLSLKWGCAFEKGNKSARSDVRYERICVLFNAASAESYTAAMEERDTESGLKRACHSFQLSAGMFSTILTLTSGNGLPGTTSDLSPSGLALCRDLMLAQAQSCVYEKAVGSRKGNKEQNKGVKPSVLSKIAKAAAEFYEQALKMCKSSTLSRKLDPTWSHNLQSQSLSFNAAANYWESVNVKIAAMEKGAGYGEEIARLEQAENFAEQAVMFGAKSNIDTTSTSNLLSIVKERKEEAENDNRTIYLEPVPNGNALTQIKGATLVKPLPLPSTLTTLPPSTPPLFPGLLPKLARGSLSRYNTTIAENINEAKERIAKADKNARESLQRINLPQSLEAYLAGDGLPPAVWSRVSNAQSMQPRTTLSTANSEVNSTSMRCRALLTAAVTTLDSQLEADRIFRSNNPKYDPTVTVSQQQIEMRKQINHYQQLLDNASKSDAVIAKNFNSDGTKASLGLLDKTKMMLDAEMPSKDPNSSASDTIDTTVLQKALVDLTNVMAVRAAALKHFQEATSSFNITEALSSVPTNPTPTTEDYDRVANEGLAKFDEVQIDIQTNIESQQDLLRKIFEENQKFQSERKSDTTTQLREAFVKKVEGAVETFVSLHSQLVEGKNFYDSIVQRLVQVKNTAEDQKLMMEMWHDDYLNDLQYRQRSASQEETDAALAKALAEECSIDDVRRDKDAQERADAAFAASLVASEEQEAENARAAEQIMGKEEEEGKKEKSHPTPGDYTGGVSGMLSSWWNGSASEDKKGLSQPLTMNQYPAAIPPPPTTANSNSSTGLMASSAYSGGGDAPPIPTDIPPPVFRDQRSNSYEPPSISGAGAVVPPPVPPPPSFDAAMAQINGVGKSGGGGKADEAKVQQLTPMGFSEVAVRRALEHHNNDLDLAMNELLSG
mmetsp:Transcript_16055/g.32927  ORF Transcript_16055/g.32927 Transcript_16055/m.32927 type:complete len:987 (+) Transcript_16055:42-3002(+)